MMLVTLRFPRIILVAAAFSFGIVLPPSEHVLLAQDTDRPAIEPPPRTTNLTQEQRFIVKENVKDLGLAKARKDAPETIGDPVPQDIELHSLPPEVAAKVVASSFPLVFHKGR
jgi:hypothetical protein